MSSTSHLIPSQALVVTKELQEIKMKTGEDLFSYIMRVCKKQELLEKMKMPLNPTVVIQAAIQGFHPQYKHLQTTWMLTPLKTLEELQTQAENFYNSVVVPNKKSSKMDEAHYTWTVEDLIDIFSKARDPEIAVNKARKPGHSTWDW